MSIEGDLPEGVVEVRISTKSGELTGRLHLRDVEGQRVVWKAEVIASVSDDPSLARRVTTVGLRGLEQHIADAHRLEATARAYQRIFRSGGIEPIGAIVDEETAAVPAASSRGGRPLQIAFLKGVALAHQSAPRGQQFKMVQVSAPVE